MAGPLRVLRRTLQGLTSGVGVTLSQSPWSEPRCCFESPGPLLLPAFGAARSTDKKDGRAWRVCALTWPHGRLEKDSGADHDRA